MPEKLDHARRLTDPTATFAVSFLADGLGVATMNLGVPGLADGVEAVNLEVAFDTDLAVQWALVCRDDDSAQQINGMISGLWALVKMQGLQNQEPAARELADVVRLVEAGVDEDVIIHHVKKHYLTAPLSADDLILLTKSKATTKVITTVQEIPTAPKSQQPK